MKKEMLPPRRVRILESKYIENSDLIQWTLHFLDDGTDQIYVWPSVDLLKALNITSKVNASHLHKFCSDMLNKEINFVIDKEPKMPEAFISTKEYNDLSRGLSDHFDLFKKSVEKDE